MDKNTENWSEGVASRNDEYTASSSLQLRLDTRPILQDIEFFLRGKEVNTFVDENTGRAYEKLVNVGVKKANDKGLQAILNYCRSMFNSQIVQCNWTKEDYYFQFIREKRIEFCERLVINYYDWELSSEDVINEITDFVMNLLEPFLSRGIGNLEREGYTNTLRTTETNNFSKPNKLFGLGGGE